MGDAEYIAIILVLLVIVLVLVGAVVHLYKIVSKVVYKVEEKLSDIELELHFATDNYLLNERKKQRENGTDLVD